MTTPTFPEIDKVLKHLDDLESISGKSGPSIKLRAAILEVNDIWNKDHAAAHGASQAKPLTDEQIYELYSEPRSDAEMVAFARAVEATHGIGEQA